MEELIFGILRYYLYHAMVKFQFKIILPAYVNSVLLIEHQTLTHTTSRLLLIKSSLAGPLEGPLSSLHASIFMYNHCSKALVLYLSLVYTQYDIFLYKTRWLHLCSVSCLKGGHTWYRALMVQGAALSPHCLHLKGIDRRHVLYINFVSLSPLANSTALLIQYFLYITLLLKAMFKRNIFYEMIWLNRLRLKTVFSCRQRSQETFSERKLSNQLFHHAS